MEIYSFDMNELNTNINIGKDILLRQLYKDGYLTKEQYDETAKSYALLVHTKGVLGRTLESLLELFTEKGSNVKISVIKVL